MAKLENQTEHSNQNNIYLDYYRLREPPFSIVPDPDFLFPSQTHQQVSEKVIYGIHSRCGFILLSGEVGTGKTTICRTILDTLSSAAEIVYLINPSIPGRDLISTILDDLGVQTAADASKKELIDQLNDFILNRDRKKPVVIIIDDAQTMPLEALEDLRLLSNLETDKEKLLQFVLVGQPEIEAVLSRAEMRQLKQRIIVNCRLKNLSYQEVSGYIDQRLFIAGNNGRIQFTPKAKRKIAKYSRGIPRIINKICDYALIAGYTSDEFIIHKKQVQKALMEINGIDRKTSRFFSIWSHLIDPEGISRSYAPLLSTAAVGLLLIFLLLPGLDLGVSSATLRGIIQPNATAAGKQELIPDSEAVCTTEPKATHSIGASLTSIVPALKKDGPPLDSRSQSKQLPEKDFWMPTYMPFVIQLATLQSMAQVKRAISIYKAQGLDVKWNPVTLKNRAKRYRIFTGYFKTKADAMKVKQDYDLKDSLIRFNPWSVLIGRYSDVKNLTFHQELLNKNHYDSHIINSGDGIYWLLTGAFASQKEAKWIVADLHKLNFTAEVVPH